MGNMYDTVAGPSSYDNILTTTMRAQLKATPQDQFWGDFVTLDWMNRNGSIKKKGGERISVPLEYADQGESEFYRGNGVINTESNEFLSEAFFEWCEAATTIKMSRREGFQNSGPEKLNDLLGLKKKNALKSMKTLLLEALFNTVPGAVDINSLPEIVNTADPSRGNLGGVDRDTYAWYKGVLTSASSTPSFASFGLSLMRTMYTDIASSMGKNTSSVIVTTPLLFDAFEKAIQPQARYMDSKMADAGFMSLRFREVPVVWEKNCNTGYMYWLNSDAINLVVESTSDFVIEPFVKPGNATSRMTQMVWAGNIVPVEPRRLGVITGLTA